jgi:hypothetical protein
MAHGLIRASFVPPAPIQELRDLTRTRKQLGREIVQHTQRIQKVLEDANIKLSSLITEVLGASGRRILKALIAGESDAGALAALGGPRLKCSLWPYDYYYPFWSYGTFPGYYYGG